MLFEEYRRKINVASTLSDLNKILNEIELDDEINNIEYLELKKILNNREIEINKKQKNIEEDYVEKDKREDKGFEK